MRKSFLVFLKVVESIHGAELVCALTFSILELLMNYQHAQHVWEQLHRC